MLDPCRQGLDNSRQSHRTPPALPRPLDTLTKAVSKRGSVTTGLVRVGPLMALPDVLRGFGVEPDELLAPFGVRADYFADPENILSFVTAGEILCRCVEISRCEHFGLLVGRRAGLSSLGPIGFLMQSAPDVRSALEALFRHLHVHDSGAVITLDSAGAYVSLGYTILQHEVPCREQILAIAMAIGLNILRGLCGADWQPDETHFAFRRPRDPAPYREFMGPRVRFDAESSAFVFASRWLDRPLAGADPLLHRLMRERVSELERLAGDDLITQVRRILRTLVMTPDCSLEAAARLSGMHGRTFNRRLAGHRTSFLELREEARRELACQLLESTSKPANQVAVTLGYTDASSFTRAFKRWTGMTPGHWRADRGRAHPRTPPP